MMKTLTYRVILYLLFQSLQKGRRGRVQLINRTVGTFLCSISKEKAESIKSLRSFRQRSIWLLLLTPTLIKRVFIWNHRWRRRYKLLNSNINHLKRSCIRKCIKVKNGSMVLSPRIFTYSETRKSKSWSQFRWTTLVFSIRGLQSCLCFMPVKVNQTKGQNHRMPESILTTISWRWNDTGTLLTTFSKISRDLSKTRTGMKICKALGFWTFRLL